MLTWFHYPAALFHVFINNFPLHHILTEKEKKELAFEVVMLL